MLNSSVAQLDEFIRSQKQKLNIDKMNYMNSMQNDNQMMYDGNPNFYNGNMNGYPDPNAMAMQQQQQQQMMQQGLYAPPPPQQLMHQQQPFYPQQVQFMNAPRPQLPQTNQGYMQPPQSAYIPQQPQYISQAAPYSQPTTDIYYQQQPQMQMQQAPYMQAQQQQQQQQQPFIQPRNSFNENQNNQNVQPQAAQRKSDIFNQAPQPIAKPRFGRNNRNNADEQTESFFSKFGSYDKQKQKLNNDLHQEYNNFLKSKPNNNKRQANNPATEYYATLPIGERERGGPPAGLTKKFQSTDNISRTARVPTNPITHQNSEPRSKSHADAFPERGRRMLEDDGSYNNGYSQNAPMYANAVSADPYRMSRPPAQRYPEGDMNRNIDMIDRLDTRMRMHESSYQNYVPSFAPQGYAQPPVANNIDPSLTDILRRPPVGSALSAPHTPRVQFNEHIQTYDSQPDLYREQNTRRNPDPYPQERERERNYAPNRQVQNPNKPINRHESNVFNFDGGQDNSAKDAKKDKMREYQEELQRQVREKQLKKQKEKDEEEKMFRKIEAEALNYNPYGRGGAGAPLRDKNGNIQADLRNSRPNENDPNAKSAYEIAKENKNPYEPAVSSARSVVQPDNSSNDGGFFNGGGQLNTPKPNEPGNHARGGHGIFGEAKTDAQKRQQEKYQEELKAQVEEKRKRDAMEKEKIRLEEEREMKRVEEQNKRIKAELEEEERKKREKEVLEKQRREESERLAIEQKNAPKPRKFGNKNPVAAPPSTSDKPPTPPAQRTEFRTNSPPLPAQKNNAAKKVASQVETLSIGGDKNNDLQNGNYFVTEARLEISSPVVTQRPPLQSKSKGYESPTESIKRRVDPTTARIEKRTNEQYRPPSVKSNTSSSEVLQQLKNLKKHLNIEQQQVETELKKNKETDNYYTRRDTDRMLVVNTPPSVDERLIITPVRVRREQSDVHKYHLNGGQEPKTYYRENSVILKDTERRILKEDNNPLHFQTDLEKDAQDRQYNKNTNPRSFINDETPYDSFQITDRNQQRLKRLKDMEDDNVSMGDPNDVLNRFLNRNNSTSTPHVLRIPLISRFPIS